MKFFLLSMLFSLSFFTVSAQKGIGLEGRVFSSDNGSSIPGQKVFVVFEQSAQPYVQNLHNQLITASDGSFFLNAPDIPNTVIPLEVMVYTYDCDLHRKGYLLTFNYNNVVGEDIDLSVCTGPIHLPMHVFETSPPDNTCPSFARVHANDSLNRKYLLEEYSWSINNIPAGTNSSIDAFFTNDHNVLHLTQSFTDSITGFFVDSVQVEKNFDIPSAGLHILGGNVLYEGGNTVTGTAVLLGRCNNDYFVIDTTQYQQYGYFYFTSLPRCNYSVRIIEADGNIDDSSVPTYLGSVFQWESATYVNLSADEYCANITLPSQQSTTGICEISGTINADDPSGYDVLLYTENMTPFSFRHCATNGYFHFTGIPYGNYWLFSEKFGFTAASQPVSLSMSNPSAYISLNTITQTGELERSGLTMFPNPAEDYLQLIPAPEGEIHIFTIDGKEVVKSSATNGVVDVQQLSAGMYFLQTSMNGQPITIQFVVSR